MCFFYGENNIPPQPQTARQKCIQSVYFNNIPVFQAFIIRRHTCSDRLQGSSSREPSNLPPVAHVARTTESELAAHESVSHSNRLASGSHFDQSGARCLQRNPCCCPILTCRSREGGASRVVRYTKHPSVLTTRDGPNNKPSVVCCQAIFTIYNSHPHIDVFFHSSKISLIPIALISDIFQFKT